MWVWLVTALPLSQVIQVAQNAGFTGTGLVTAVAVAEAESGFDPNNQCLNCFPGVTENSQGLWQINIDANPQYASSNLYDPATNAAIAYQMSKGGTSWTPWSTYTGGQYSKYTGAVQSAIAQMGTTSIASPSSTAASQTVASGGTTAAGVAGTPTSVGTDTGATVCGQCGPSNIPACLQCLDAGLTAGLTHIGVNIMFGVIIVIGIILMFHDADNTSGSNAVKTVVETVKSAAKSGAEVAE
jgi:hypothetical protein